MQIEEHGLEHVPGRNGRPGYKITVDGVTYTTLAALAAAYGLLPRTVAVNRAKGTLQQLLERGVSWYTDTHSVTINGVQYASKNAAAAVFGVTPSAISKAIHRGKLDETATRWAAKVDRIKKGS
jgi:hypothetical protein